MYDNTVCKLTAFIVHSGTTSVELCIASNEQLKSKYHALRIICVSNVISGLQKNFNIDWHDIQIEGVPLRKGTKVFKGYYAGHVYAMKRIFWKTKEKEEVLRNVARWGSVSHENIAAWCGQTQPEDSGMCVLMEFVRRSDLASYISPQFGQRPLQKEHGIDIMIGISSAVSFLHSNKIIHGNLKPSCIMVSDIAHNVKNNHPVKVLLCGFPTSVTGADTEDRSTFQDAFYMAKEILVKNETPTEESDVWSMGVIAFEVFVEREYWLETEIRNVKDKMDNEQHSPQREKLYNMQNPPPFYKPILRALKYAKPERITSKAMADSFKECQDEVAIRGNEKRKKKYERN